MTTQTSILLLRAASEVRAVFTKCARRNLTLAQAVTLLAVCRQPGMKQTELFAWTGSDRSTMSAMLMRMERMGWVTCLRDPEDMRAVRVTPTARGRRIRNAAEAALEKTSQELSGRVRGPKYSLMCLALQEIAGMSDA